MENKSLTKGGELLIKETLAKAKAGAGKGKPSVIVMKTEMGKGVDFMEGTHKWHGSAPNAEQGSPPKNCLTHSDTPLRGDAGSSVESVPNEVPGTCGDADTTAADVQPQPEGRGGDAAVGA